MRSRILGLLVNMWEMLMLNWNGESCNSRKTVKGWLKSCQGTSKSTAVRSKRWVFTTERSKNRRCWALKLGFGGPRNWANTLWYEVSQAWGFFFSLLFPQNFEPRCGHERTEGLARILFGFAKAYFEKALDWKAQLSTVSKCCESMNGSLSQNHIFLSLYLKNDSMF